MFNGLYLSSILQMRHVIFKKKDGMPKKHDPKKRKKMDTSMSIKKEKKIYIAMSSCYPNKGERDS